METVAWERLEENIVLFFVVFLLGKRESNVFFSYE